MKECMWWHYSIHGLFSVMQKQNHNEPMLSRRTLGQTVLDVLKKLTIYLIEYAAIGTDGCSVMTSDICRAVKEIQTEAINASWCPCFTKIISVQNVRNVTGIMKETTYFFTTSAKETMFWKVWEDMLLGCERLDGLRAYCCSVFISLN